MSKLDKNTISRILEVEEIKELDGKLYTIQKSVFEKMLKYIQEEQNPNVLLDIATGFGKSFIQISFAGILEHAKVDYKIVVPDNLVLQLKRDVEILFSGSTAENIKKKIAGHENFFLKDWEKTKELQESTFLMIDEVDSATHEDLYRKRFKFLSNKHPSIALSATSQKWLYNSIKETQIISISLEEKIKEMGIIPAYSNSIVAKSIMERTNKRSGFLPFACIIVTSYLLTLLFKICLNSYVIEGFIHLSTLYNFYNLYLNTFIYHPVIGQISLFTIALPILTLINLIVDKIANRDISGRFIANLVDEKNSSPAHGDAYESEGTFICKKANPNEDINIHSPRGKKALILACNYDVIRNLSLIYQDEKAEIYENGKLLNNGKVHDQYKLGKDFGEKYDFSYKESQRRWCIIKCAEEIKRNHRSLSQDEINKRVNKVDFSDISAYSEYRVMHGVINSTLLVLLQECYDDKGNKKYDDVIALNKARVEKPQELFKDVKDALKNKKGDEEYIKKYLKNKGFQDDLLVETTKNIGYAIQASRKDNSNENYDEFLETIVRNSDLDKRLHNMMKIGDEYQVLDDICGEFKRLTNSIPNDIGIGFRTRFKSNHPHFHDFNNDFFDDVYKDQLERYLKKKFGLESNEFIKEMYNVLQSQDYPALASLFKKYNLIEKINAKESEFPLYKLREVCKQNKIVFDNLSDLKINGPFTGFDQEGKPREYEYTSEEVTKLFTEGWMGTLVDPSKGTGFSDPTLQNVAMIIGAKDDEINNPDKIYQGYGRNRGLDPTQQPFFRMVARKGVTLCFDVKKLIASNITQLLFNARTNYNKGLLKTIGQEAAEEIILHISDNMDNNKKVDNKFCEKIVVEKLTDLYNRNDHDLGKTKKEFSRVLKDLKKGLVSYKKNLKTQGKPSVLYAVPYYIAYLFSKILYYLWILPDYVIFSLRTIGIDKVVKDVASAEETYVHIINNYTFESSIENQRIIEKLLELSRNKPELFDKLLNNPICKKALKKVVLPLQDEHIRTILSLMYPTTDNNNYQVKVIKSLVEKIKNKEEIKNDREAINCILEISKEIVAAHAWYHDSSETIGVNPPKLKNDSKVFYIRNVGNAGKFISSLLYRNDGKFSFLNQDGKEYRKNYGNAHLQRFILFIKWFPLLVVFPQFPYLLTTNIALATSISTIVICIPLMAFVFGCPEKFRSLVFNKPSAACNELELIANEEKIPFIKSAASFIENKISSQLSNIKELDDDYVKNNGDAKHTNPINLHFETKVNPQFDNVCIQYSSPHALSQAMYT